MSRSYFLSYVVLESIAAFRLGEHHFKFRALRAIIC